MKFRRQLFVLAVALAAAAAADPEPSPEPSLAEVPSRFATLDGHRVHYKLLGQGKGEPLVFVHGWACDMSVWRFQAPAFGKGRKVIVLDLPGHGASDAPEIAYTMGVFARSVDAVMQDAGAPRAVLVGHSMGMPVIRQFYRRFPKKTVALVAVDGSLRPYIADPTAIERFLAPYRGPDFRQAQARFIGGMFPAGDAGLRDAIMAVALQTPQHVMVSALEGMFDPAIWKEDSIEVPLLCVLAKSPFWSEDYEAFVRRLAPGADYRVLDSVSHFLMLEKPEEFNAILAAFLAKPPR